MELEPLLYKDEYEFPDPTSEKLFDEDQRKAKELRRQQYNNRNFAKIREVTIIKVEYLKQRASKILEQWFEENNQPMNKETIEMFADELELDPETFQKMHDIFLEDRTLFGKDNLELNRLIYNDKRQQTLSRINTLTKEPEELTPVNDLFDSHTKQTPIQNQESESDRPGDRKRRSKQSRQRRQNRSKSQDRERVNNEPVNPATRRETSQTKRLQEKASKSKAEEQRIRLILQEAIRGEEAAKIRLEAASSKRKSEDYRERQQGVDEYERAKREALEYGELRKQAEEALHQASRQSRLDQKEVDERILLMQSQADTDVRKARQALLQEAKNSEVQRDQLNKEMLKDRTDDSKSELQQYQAQKFTSENQKNNQISENGTSKDSDLTRKFMKKAAITLIDKKVKEEQQLKDQRLAETSTTTKNHDQDIRKSKENGIIESHSRGNDKTSNQKQSKTEIEKEEQTRTIQIKESQSQVRNSTEQTLIKKEVHRANNQQNTHNKEDSVASQQGRLSQESGEVTTFKQHSQLNNHTDQNTTQSRENTKIKEEKNNINPTQGGLSAAQEDWERQSEASFDRPLNESFASHPQDALVDGVDRAEKRSEYGERESEVDYNDQDEESFQLVPVVPFAEQVKEKNTYEERAVSTHDKSKAQESRKTKETQGESASYAGGKKWIEGQTQERREEATSKVNGKKEITFTSKQGSPQISEEKKKSKQESDQKVNSQSNSYQVVKKIEANERSKVQEVATKHQSNPTSSQVDSKIAIDSQTIEKSEQRGSIRQKETKDSKNNKETIESTEGLRNRSNAEYGSMVRNSLEGKEITTHKNATIENERTSNQKEISSDQKKIKKQMNSSSKKQEESSKEKNIQTKKIEDEEIARFAEGQQDSIEERLFNQACKETSEIDSEHDGGVVADQDRSDDQFAKERDEVYGSDIDDEHYADDYRENTHKVNKNDEFQRLLEEEKRLIEERLRREYEEKFSRAKQEAVEDILLKKDTYQKICRKQLWDLFLQFCREVLVVKLGITI